ncbi:MAG: response regulator [Lachnospiraceae bacterium]|nr:response regulator [Lachnospiraceae bacterium]
MEDKYYYDEKILIRTERAVLGIVTCYIIALFVLSQVFGWNIFVRELIVVMAIALWIICVKKYRGFKYRAICIAVVSWINFIIYAVHIDNILLLTPIMSGLIILLSLFCNLSIVYTGLIISNLVFVYHGLIVRTIPLETGNDIFMLVLHILASFVTTFVAVIMIRSRTENSLKLYKIIRNLEIAEQGRDDFMVNMSHEIRTPINAVCGMSEAILQENIPENVRKDVIDIQTAGRNLLATVSNILDYSELLGGELDLAEESYNITSTITDIINMALTLENGRHLELIVDCDANLPSNMVGDEQKIRRIVMNMLENAIKFTHEGGIVITIRSRKEKYGVNLIVNIKDSGIGIEPSDLEQIFTTYTQVDAKRNREEGGAGIGLAITRALVRKMGGFITVNSEPGIGSEFQLTIPQKVLDESPIVSIRNRQEFFTACYINMDKYNYSIIREGYEKILYHIVEQFGIMFRFCKNLSELKRRLEHENYSHVFIGWEEYSEDKNFFEELAQKCSVVLILDYRQEVRAGSNMLRIYKPFTVLSIAAIFNGGKIIQRDDQYANTRHRFIAPDAKVLVVDDNTMNLKVMARLLLPYQIKVTLAGSGEEALDKLDTMDFDCVFLDHMMPEMDGVETLHKIRQKPGTYFQTLSVIAFTANAIGGAREMFLSEGFNDFIAKPIELSVLERMLRRYIPVQKQIAVDNTPKNSVRVDDNVAEVQDRRNSDKEALVALERAGIDVKQGISYCDDEEGFREILGIYHTEGPKRRQNIEELFEEENWKDYVILVHALKSNSKGIGANEVANLALELEMAGKEGRTDFILQNHEKLMEIHDALLEVLDGNAFVYPDSKPDTAPALKAPQSSTVSPVDEGSFDKASFDELLAQLTEKLDRFENDELDQLLDRLAKCPLPDGGEQKAPFAQVAERIREKVNDFDFLAASDILNSWKEERKG